MVLFDWEKAFDKVKHDKLFEAMERMSAPDKCIKAIKDFRVDMGGKTSEWTRQTAGIRQGCPLSPYLFLILMTCLFHDVHGNDKVDAIKHRVQGAEEDEVLYADDTICISQDEKAMNIISKGIEKEGAIYGLKQNRTKCECLRVGAAGKVRFADGTPAHIKHEVKHLGCNLNDRRPRMRNHKENQKQHGNTQQNAHILV